MFKFTKKMAKAAVGLQSPTVDASFTLRLQSLSTPSTYLREDNGKNLSEDEMRMRRVKKKAMEGGGLSDDSSEDEGGGMESNVDSGSGKEGNNKEGSSSNPFDDGDTGEVGDYQTDDDEEDSLDSDAAEKDAIARGRRISLPPGNNVLNKFVRREENRKVVDVKPQGIDDEAVRQLIEQLPSKEWLEEDFDPLIPTMRNLPFDDSELGPYLQHQITQVDDLITRLHSHLIRAVSSHQETLLSFTKHLSDLNMEFAQCLVAENVGRRFLKNVGVKEDQKVVEEANRRKRLVQVKSIIDEVVKVHEIVGHLTSPEPTWTLPEQVVAACDVLQFITSSGGMGLRCLDSIRGNKSLMFSDIRDRAISGVVKVLVKGGENVEEYRSCIEGGIKAEVKGNLGGADLGTRIVEALCERTDEIFIDVLAGSAEGTIGDVVRSVRVQDWSGRYRAAVREFADILHGWFCVDQLNRDFWGRTDWEWLHRDGGGDGGTSGGFDDSDEDDEEDDNDDGDSDNNGGGDEDGNEGEIGEDIASAVQNALFSPTPPTPPREKVKKEEVKGDTSNDPESRMTSVKITLLSRTLRGARGKVWLHMQNLLTTAINEIKDGGEGIDKKAIRSILQCSKQMMAIVEEFCEGDTHALKTAVSDLCRAYFKDVQTECIEVISDMLMNETWRFAEVGVRVRGRRGLVKLLNNQLKDQNRNKFKLKQKTLVSWINNGNPFDDDDVEDDEEKQKKDETQSPSADLQSILSSSATSWPGAENSEDYDSDNPRSSSSSAAPDFNTSFWATVSENWEDGSPSTTQTVLNGIVKVLARYIDIINVLPSITQDVVAGLTKLIDIYYLVVLSVAAGGRDIERCWGDMGTGGGESAFHQMSKMMHVGSEEHSDIAEICAPYGCDKDEYEVALNFVKRARKKVGDVVSSIQRFSASSGPVSFEGRVAALESTMFVAALIDTTKEKLPMMSDYRNELVKLTPQIIKLGNKVAAVDVVRGDVIVASVVAVGKGGGWEVEELEMESNGYIEDILDLAAELWGQLAGRDGFLSERLLEIAWREIVGGVYASLLEGFGKIQSCSTEGRALMSMDLQSFASSIANSLVDRVGRRSSLQRAPSEFSAVGVDLELKESEDGNMEEEGGNPFGEDSDEDDSPPPINPFAPKVEKLERVRKEGEEEEQEEEEEEGRKDDDDDDDEFILREPPKVAPAKGKLWVDAYTKAWYYQEEDLFKWISQNKSNYRLNQCISLVTSGVGKEMKKKDIRNLIAKIKNVYG